MWFCVLEIKALFLPTHPLVLITSLLVPNSPFGLEDRVAVTTEANPLGTLNWSSIYHSVHLCQGKSLGIVLINSAQAPPACVYLLCAVLLTNLLVWCVLWAHRDCFAAQNLIFKGPKLSDICSALVKNWTHSQLARHKLGIFCTYLSLLPSIVLSHTTGLSSVPQSTVSE